MDKQQQSAAAPKPEGQNSKKGSDRKGKGASGKRGGGGKPEGKPKAPAPITAAQKLSLMLLNATYKRSGGGEFTDPKFLETPQTAHLREKMTWPNVSVPEFELGTYGFDYTIERVTTATLTEGKFVNMGGLMVPEDMAAIAAKKHLLAKYDGAIWGLTARKVSSLDEIKVETGGARLVDLAKFAGATPVALATTGKATTSAALAAISTADLLMDLKRASDAIRGNVQGMAYWAAHLNPRAVLVRPTLEVSLAKGGSFPAGVCAAIVCALSTIADKRPRVVVSIGMDPLPFEEYISAQKRAKELATEEEAHQELKKLVQRYGKATMLKVVSSWMEPSGN